MTEIKKSTCVACRGTVVQQTTMEYLGDPMHMIIGPGSRNQMTRVTNIHCMKCGLKYEFLPPEHLFDVDSEPPPSDV